MTASPRLRYLAGSVLALSVAWGFAPSAAEAGGKPDFTISVSVISETPYWIGPGALGVFSSTGDISDSGTIYYVGAYTDLDGRLWCHCLFAGASGSFETDLPEVPESSDTDLFELTNGTEEYAGLYAIGTMKGQVREAFFWYDDDLTTKKWKWTYYEASWTMKGFLNP